MGTNPEKIIRMIMSWAEGSKSMQVAKAFKKMADYGGTGIYGVGWARRPWQIDRGKL